MSNSMPLFTSAPRIRLSLNGATVGFAVGFNINLNIDIQPVYTIGQYNAAFLEPTMYNPVTGTIQLLRIKKGDGGINNTVVGNGPALGHLDPSTVLATTLFNMDVYVKVPKFISASVTTVTSIQTSEVITDAVYDKEGNLVSAAVLKPTGSSTKIESAQPNHLAVGNVKGTGGNLALWMQIQDVRLTSRNTNITLGQIVNEPVSFQGLLLKGEVDSWGLDESVVQG